MNYGRIQISYLFSLVVSAYTYLQLVNDYKARKKIGALVVNFRRLAHTLLMSQNISIIVTAAKLAHAQISTTFTFYMHLIILEVLLILNKT